MNKQVKFTRGDKVLLGDNEYTIKVSRKNFSNGQILYHLNEVNGEYAQEDLKPVKEKSGKQSKKADKELEFVRRAYQDVVGKEVPSNKKNDKEWLQAKIDEVKNAPDPEGTGNPPAPNDDDDPYETIAALSRDQVELLIIEKGLEIEAEDYEDDDLVIAVCEELDIEVPEAE